jgi:chemotaxis protein methyltransferase CheR
MKALAALIGAYAGLDPPAWLLEARARERADELGLDEDGYVALVGGAGDAAARERATLAERLRVGETRFFRHRAQVEALRARVVPELFARASRPVRAWSAGCSTGEEAFTLALIMDEAAPREAWEVVGTDLSPAAVATAGAARWPLGRLEEIPEAMRRHFSVEQRTILARPELRTRVRFETQNLLDPRHPRGVDLLLCRNVLIYFDAARRAQVIARLSDALRPNGWLFLGYSESLRNFEEARLEPVRVGDAVLYRRREITAKIELPHDDGDDDGDGDDDDDDDDDEQSTSVSVNVNVNANVNANANANANANDLRVLRLRGEYPDGTRLQAELRPFLSAPATIDLDGAGFLGDDAARVLSRAQNATPSLRLRATRPAVLRWMAKHGLVKP